MTEVKTGGRAAGKTFQIKEWLAEMARKGATVTTIPGARMCNDCAFKPGTDANNDEAAVTAAGDCLGYGGIFMCHTPDFKCTDHQCAGFQYAIAYLNSKHGNSRPNEEPEAGELLQ